MKLPTRLVPLLFAFLLAATPGLGGSASARAQSPDSSAQPETKYTLRYRFHEGETVRTQVVHQASTETRINGNTQTSKSRSVSTKVWKIKQIDDAGNITFEHMISDVEMSQQSTGRSEVRYNSKTDSEIPKEYEPVAKTVGVKLAEVTITPAGEVVDREGRPAGLDLGLGPIATPLPKEPVQVGDKWHLPNEVRVRVAGQVKTIKTRQQFILEKVQTGVATISVRTQVLTPVDDAKVQSQLVQQLTNGKIKFDVDTGRIISKQIDWDETVVGFNGADSMMEYIARFTEDALSDNQPQTAARPSGPAPRRNE